MKKQTRKLRLSRETVRDLGRASLAPVAGGGITDGNCTLLALGCAPISPPTKTDH